MEEMKQEKKQIIEGDKSHMWSKQLFPPSLKDTFNTEINNNKLEIPVSDIFMRHNFEEGIRKRFPKAIIEESEKGPMATNLKKSDEEKDEKPDEKKDCIGWDINRKKLIYEMKSGTIIHKKKTGIWLAKLFGLTGIADKIGKDIIKI